MISSPAGNDLLFDESALDQGRSFNNKMWNALKLVNMWKDKPLHNPELNSAELKAINWPNEWMQNRISEARAEVDKLMKQFRLSEALKTIYSLIWDDFCSWYLELIKPGFDEPVNAVHLNAATGFYENLLQMLHPFMPFITEEIYSLLQVRTENDKLCIRQFSQLTPSQELILNEGKLLKEVITGIRDARNKAQIKPKEQVKIHIITQNKEVYNTINALVAKQINAGNISFVQAAVANTICTVIGHDQFYIETEQPVNSGSQKEDLLKELEYLKGFLVSVEKKLSNERFVQNAKTEVVEMEQRKKEDAINKIRVIEESLANF